MRLILIVFLTSSKLFGQTDLQNWFQTNIHNIIHFEGNSLQITSTYVNEHVLQMYNNEADASLIIVKHHFSYGLGNDTLMSQGQVAQQ